jgi:uncharacterized membrane protein
MRKPILFLLLYNVFFLSRRWNEIVLFRSLIGLLYILLSRGTIFYGRSIGTYIRVVIIDFILTTIILLYKDVRGNRFTIICIF